MLTPTDIVQVPLNEWHLERAMYHAQRAEIGGRSQIRGSDRAALLATDQVVGQLGQVALHWYWFGSLERYESSRWMQNQYPTSGDGGFDVPGLGVDVKTSLIRTSLAPINHRLLVRPRERHAQLVYVLALVTPDFKFVHLVGWLADTKLVGSPATDGPFQGAHVVQAKDLNPMMPFRYAWTAA